MNTFNTTNKNMIASQMGLSKDFGTSALITNEPLNKASKINKPPRKVKPKGTLKIVTPIVKTARPKMVSDMAVGQTFTRDGHLCMRVLNVCNNNIKGQASKAEELWIVNLSQGKVQLATDTPVEVVEAVLEIKKV